MLNEADINEVKKLYYEENIKTAISNIQKRHMGAQYVPNRQEALATLLKMIPPGVTVSRGDSVSLYQIGIIPQLRNANRNKVIDPSERSENGSLINVKQQKRQLEREMFFSDIFLTSAEAITLDGKIMCLDGHGSRVSPMILGPEKVIVVVGINKIVKDADEGQKRITSISAPMNNMRHFLKHNIEESGTLPCVKTGKCIDCRSEWRSCNYRVIIEGSLPEDHGRINILLVGEELGI